MLTMGGLFILVITAGAAPAHHDFGPQRDWGTVQLPRSVPMFQVSSEADVVDISAVRDRIHASRKAGIISKHEARALRREASVLERHAELYGRDGYSDTERAELQARARYLADAAYHPAQAGTGGK